MSGKDRINFLRGCRAVVAVCLVLNAVLGVASALRGYDGAFFNAGAVALLVLVMCLQTFVIRRQRRTDAIASRPRPDYSAIAAMEREVYGETFEHEGAPKPFTYPSAALLPPKGYGVTMAEFGENLARLGRSDSLPSVRPVRMVAGQTKMCKRCMTPYARLDGFCSRCYRTCKQAQRDS